MNEAVTRLLEAHVASGTMSGATLAVRWREGATWRASDLAVGTLRREPSAAVTVETRFDLASVTKVFVALAFVEALAQRSIGFNTPLARVWERARGAPAADVTLEQLASHRGGLVAWRPFFERVSARDAEAGRTHDAILDAVLAEPLEGPPGAARYSDLGYILLGEALADHEGCPLEEAISRDVLDPLGIDPRDMAYRAVSPDATDATIAATEDSPWRGAVMQGRVHDENAFALGGTAGHAGLFGTASALARVGTGSIDSLAGDKSWFLPDAMRAMVAPRPGGSHRLGWDGKSDGASSAGTRMSARTFGHLGFTGTSLWCDPEANVVIALLTNRVHPSREGAGIRALRPALHDTVMHALGR